MVKFKRSVSSIVLMTLVFSVLLSSITGLTAFAAENGKCGKNLKWSFSAGTLTITGKGEMENYNEKVLPPWYHLRDQIISVRLPESIKSVGVLAFYNLSRLKAISIPQGVTEISDKAFYNCTELMIVGLPDSLNRIGKSAFYNCENLRSITIPANVEKIMEKAFFLCKNIVSLIIPENVKTIGSQAFAYCEGLIRVEIKAPLKSIPEWCFYGCISLAEIKLPETVTEIEEYAFKKCNSLYTVYHSGSKEDANNIRNQISEDVPNFKNSGHISTEEMGTTTQNSVIVDSLGKAEQTNTSVTTSDNMNLVTEVTSNKEQNNSNDNIGGNSNNCYSVNFTLTIEGEEGWADAIAAIRRMLAEIAEDFADSKLDSVKITILLKNTFTVSQDFLKEVAGRNIILEVIDCNSSVCIIDCSQLKFEDIKDDLGFSYTVTEAPKKTQDKLGSENCYQVVFYETAKLNTNVVISLPQKTANTNAFLYQIVAGKPKRIQASVVDGNANAHFYLSNVKEKGKYVIGINVPGEKVDDIIIPDTAGDVFGAIARLEKIEYVSPVRTLAGFTMNQILLILIGILVFLAIVVGIIVYMLYKNKLNQYPAVSKTQSTEIKPKSIKDIFKSHKK